MKTCIVAGLLLPLLANAARAETPMVVPSSVPLLRSLPASRMKTGGDLPRPHRQKDGMQYQWGTKGQTNPLEGKKRIGHRMPVQPREKTPYDLLSKMENRLALKGRPSQSDASPHRKRLWARACIVAGLLVALLANLARAETPVVVASVQPIHSLLASVMKGVGRPELLVEGQASEHGYTLKPSQARLVATAGLVVLVDPLYETFLAKPLELRQGKGETLVLAQLPGMIVLSPRVEPQEIHHHHEGIDGHLWLNPLNAKIIVNAAAEKLASMDPENGAIYRANADETSEKLTKLDDKLKYLLKGMEKKHYVVFHDAYQYFEQHYGLSPAGMITTDPDRPPSARKLAALREKLKAGKTACVFREPQFPADVVRRLVVDSGANEGVLDPQGAALTPGEGLYFALLTELGEGFVACLGEQ